MRRLSMFLSLFFLLLLLALATRAAEEESLLQKLSPEILRIIEGNQATLDSVRTLQAIVTKQGTITLPGKGSRQFIERKKIWQDGAHLRRDLLEARFIGKETKSLIIEERGFEREKLEPPKKSSIEMSSIECRLSYIPQNQKVFIRPSNWNDMRITSTNELLRFQAVLDASLKDNILKSAMNGYYFSIAKREKVDEDDCVLLTCDYTNPHFQLRIWVVPSKGYCIKKMQSVVKGRGVVKEYTTRLKQYSDSIWWVDFVRAKVHYPEESTAFELTVDKLIFNEDIDPKTFTLAGTGIPYGTKVVDEISGLFYVYGSAYELADRDLDLVLDALEDSLGAAPGSPHVEKTQAEMHSKPHSDSVPQALEAEAKDVPQNVVATQHVGPGEATSKPYFYVLVGLGIALAICGIGLVLVRRSKP